MFGPSMMMSNATSIAVVAAASAAGVDTTHHTGMAFIGTTGTIHGITNYIPYFQAAALYYSLATGSIMSVMP
jgi:hypothetical protein